MSINRVKTPGYGTYLNKVAADLARRPDDESIRRIEEHYQSKHCKPVAAMDYTGRILFMFRSAADAAEILHLSASNIRTVISYRCAHHGLYWYHPLTSEPPTATSRKRPIAFADQLYPSKSALARTLGVHWNTIYNAIKRGKFRGLTIEYV